MKAIQITKSTQNLLDEWRQAATTDPTVWPFLNFDPHSPSMNCDDGDDWNRVFLMDDSGKGLLRFSPDRGRGNRDAALSIWVLNCRSKKRIAGFLMSNVAGLCRRYGVKFLRAACHESNSDSEKILRRRFGDPCGVDRENGWNGLVGRWESTLHFRASVEEYGKVRSK